MSAGHAFRFRRACPRLSDDLIRDPDKPETIQRVRPGPAPWRPAPPLMPNAQHAPHSAT
jgi:hypothetical protein